MVTKAFPGGDIELTQLIVVGDLATSVAYYRDVLGAEPYREYGGDSAVMRLLGHWLLLVTGGAPTPDKPGVTFAPPADHTVVSRQMIFRVPDCRSAYETLMVRGAEFLTPPLYRGGEIRAFFRDPDGHLFEISEVVETGR